MILYRPFQNNDVPGLATLWNRGLPDRSVVHPLSGHLFDRLVINQCIFDRNGLIVALDQANRVVGFVHAGFGPVELSGPSHKLDHALGTIAMLVTDPDANGSEISLQLVQLALEYLKNKGAKVIYAGGQSPLNPFYWGLYGGSEFGGILLEHRQFHRTVEQTGFEPVSQAILLELDLGKSEVKDPRTLLTRRQYQVFIEEDALLPNWWESQALHGFHPNRYELRAKQGGPTLAEAWTFEMGTELPATDRLTYRGMFHLDVDPGHRRRGLGRLLLSECLKHARSQMIDRFCVQTMSTNVPALALYRATGFSTLSEAILYRQTSGNPA